MSFFLLLYFNLVVGIIIGVACLAVHQVQLHMRRCGSITCIVRAQYLTRAPPSSSTTLERVVS